MLKFPKMPRMLTPEGETPPDPAAVTGGTGTAAVVPPVVVAAPPVEPQTGRGAKTITMKRETLARQISEASEKARKDELTKLNSEARKLGYKNLTDLLASRKPAAVAAVPGQQAAVPPVQAGRGGRTPTAAELDRARRNQEVERKARMSAQRRARDLALENDALSAERDLIQIAHQAGVQDTDYALTLFKRSCTGKTAEQLAQFDEAAYFASLKKTHGYLFGAVPVVHVDANTSVDAGADKASPPGTRAASTQAANAGKFDARGATSAAEVAAHAARLGVRMPGR